MSLFVLRTYEEELQVLSGVRDQLETISSEKMALEKELSNLKGKYKVMETLRDSQETELETLKVPSLPIICAALTVTSSGSLYLIPLNWPNWKSEFL